MLLPSIHQLGRRHRGTRHPSAGSGPNSTRRWSEIMLPCEVPYNLQENDQQITSSRHWPVSPATVYRDRHHLQVSTSDLGVHLVTSAPIGRTLPKLELEKMGSLLGTRIGPRKLRIPKREFVPLSLDTESLKRSLAY